MCYKINHLNSLKSVQVMKNKEILIKETWQLNALYAAGLDSRPE